MLILLAESMEVFLYVKVSGPTYVHAYCVQRGTLMSNYPYIGHKKIRENIYVPTETDYNTCLHYMLVCNLRKVKVIVKLQWFFFLFFWVGIVSSVSIVSDTLECRLVFSFGHISIF